MIDYKKYPPNWKTEIRPRILKRAKNSCECCGFENYSMVFSTKEKGKATNWTPFKQSDYEIFDNQKVVRVILTIAHLDHDEGNFEVKDERLMAMCQLCHLRYDAPEKAKRRAAKKLKP